MWLKDVINVKSLVGSFLGSGIAISVALIFIKNWADKKIEKYKMELRLSKSFFDKQYEGASEFAKFYQNLLPEKNNSDMTWEDAMEDIVLDADNHVEFLRAFLGKYSFDFDENIVSLLNNCKHKADNCRVIKKERGMELDSKSYKSGEEFYECAEKTYKALKTLMDKYKKINL